MVRGNPFKGCMGCKERFVGCHSTCEKYNAVKYKLNQERENRNKKAWSESDYRDFVIGSVTATMKKSGKR